MRKNIKRDFPIFTNHPNLVYLDSAATSQKPQCVINAVNQFYAKYNAPVYRGMYSLSEEATAKFEDVRRAVAGFLKARDPSEVIFTKSTTEGINLIAYSWARHNLKSGDEIVLTILEHHANLVPWQELSKETGVVLKFAPITELGELDQEKLLSLIGTRTKLVTFPLVSNVTGEVIFAEKLISEIKKKNKQVKVLVDGAQAISRMNLDFQKLGADFFVCSGHKFYGPTGTGVLLVKKEIHREMQPFLTGGAMIETVSQKYSTFKMVPYLFEAGTQAVEAVIGMGVAIDYIQKIGIENIAKHERELTEYTIKLLGEIPLIEIIGPRNIDKRIGLVSFYHKKIHAHDIASVLASENIAVRAGHHCAMPLHQELGISASVRMSFSVFTMRSDIKKTIEVLKRIDKVVV